MFNSTQDEKCAIYVPVYGGFARVSPYGRGAATWYELRHPTCYACLNQDPVCIVSACNSGLSMLQLSQRTQHSAHNHEVCHMICTTNSSTKPESPQSANTEEVNKHRKGPDRCSLEFKSKIEELCTKIYNEMKRFRDLTIPTEDCDKTAEEWWIKYDNFCKDIYNAQDFWVSLQNDSPDTKGHEACVKNLQRLMKFITRRVGLRRECGQDTSSEIDTCGKKLIELCKELLALCHSGKQNLLENITPEILQGIMEPLGHTLLVSQVSKGLRQKFKTFKTHLNLRSRGFEEVYKQLSTLSEYNNLRHLDISHNRFSTLTLDKLIVGSIRPNLSHLSHLNLESCQIEAGGAIYMARVLGLCTSLTHLNIGHNKTLNEESAFTMRLQDSEMQEYPPLRYLNLRQCKFGSSGADYLSMTLKCCTTLTHLDLVGNEMNVGALNEITERVQLKLLAHLNLAGNRNLNLALGRLSKSLVQCRSLTHLDLANNRIHALGIQKINETDKMWLESLTYLNLTGNSTVSHPSGEKLHTPLYTMLACCTSLTHLDIADNKLRDNNVDELSQIFSMHMRMKHLNLSNNQIEFYTVVHVRQLVHLKSLTHLNLSNNKIQSRGIDCLSFYFNAGIDQDLFNESLVYMNLSKNDIRKEGLRALLRVLPLFHSLTNLNLSTTRIRQTASFSFGSDTIIPELEYMLHNSPSISHIDLTGNGITDSEAEYIRSVQGPTSLLL